MGSILPGEVNASLTSSINSESIGQEPGNVDTPVEFDEGSDNSGVESEDGDADADDVMASALDIMTAAYLYDKEDNF